MLWNLLSWALIMRDFALRIKSSQSMIMPHFSVVMGGDIEIL